MIDKLTKALDAIDAADDAIAELRKALEPVGDRADADTLEWYGDELDRWGRRVSAILHRKEYELMQKVRYANTYTDTRT